MAAPVRSFLRVISGCQTHHLINSPIGSSASLTLPRYLPIRTAAKLAWKKKKEEKTKEKVKEKKVIDNTGRHKPYGLTAWEPIDDVYRTRFYPKPVYEVDLAIDMLKTFQKLDHMPEDQPVYIDLRLDMALEKKRKVDPFVNTIHLPYPFRREINKVVVFTESPDQAKVALENGAAFVGGTDLIEKILDDELQADFYVAVPDIVAKLMPLKSKLRKRFPKSKRGSVGINILEMLELFKTGHEYMVERDIYIYTQVATLDMPKEHILANIKTILQDVALNKPASFGPILERGIISSECSEGLRFKFEELLQSTEEEEA